MFDELIHGKVYYGHVNHDPDIYANAKITLPNSQVTVTQQLQAIQTNLQCENISYLKQIHSTTHIVIEQETVTGNIEGDALITTTPNHAICVKTADCVPIILATQNGEAIAVIHAGWKGALASIVPKTIQQLRSLVNQESILAVIGPHIRQPSYEVDQGFYHKFITTDENHRELFIPSSKDGHYLFDLTAIIHQQLKKAGITQISDRGVDTYQNSLYPSYRRSTHQNIPLAGHMISTVVITE